MSPPVSKKEKKKALSEQLKKELEKRRAEQEQTKSKKGKSNVS